MTFIGDANDPVTVLSEAERFFSNLDWFSSSDDAEAAKYQTFVDEAFSERGLPPYWVIGQRTAALVQVCDLVAPLDKEVGKRYLRRLGRIAGELLRHRDDRRDFPDAFVPIDPFR